MKFFKRNKIKEKSLSKIGMLNQQNRDLWLERILKSIAPNLKILDAGAGECQYKKWCSHLQYTSQDFNLYSGKESPVGLQMPTWDQSRIDIVCDIAHLPLSNESYDVVMCTEVLEHVPDPVLVLRELDRVLKKNGTLIITAPFNSLTHFAPFHYATGFNRFFYEYHLKKLNHVIVEMKPNGNYFEYIAQETRRLPDIITRYAPSRSSQIPEVTELLEQVRLFLEEIEQDERGSDELLCFGYHVRSEKNANSDPRDSKNNDS